MKPLIAVEEAELPGARALDEELHSRGANANAGHSEALYQEIQEAADWGVRHVTHLYCAMTDAMKLRPEHLMDACPLSHLLVQIYSKRRNTGKSLDGIDWPRAASRRAALGLKARERVRPSYRSQGQAPAPERRSARPPLRPAAAPPRHDQISGPRLMKASRAGPVETKLTGIPRAFSM